MGGNLLNYLENEVNYFKNILKQRGFFYDINHLHSLLFKYNRFYTPSEIKNYWERFFKFHNDNGMIINKIDFYIHIPFCRSKCIYCVYPSWEVKSRKHLNRYIDFLIEEMRFFCKTFSHIKFRNIYMGGGTPSILSSAQLNRLLVNLFKYFSFRTNGQRTSECNPHTVMNTKFDLLRHFGFNSVSFGVQSLNARALRINKREYQEYGSIKKAIILAKRSGFKDINIDLIAGLAGDNPDYFAKSFSLMAQLQPYNIVVYGLMPPNDGYLNDWLGVSREEYFKNYYPKMISKVLRIMKSLSKKFGYIPDSLDSSGWHWGFRHKDHLSPCATETYSGEYTTGCTFGLGVFSRSHIHRLLEYRQVSYSGHFDPKSEIFEGRNLNKKEEMVKFIINQIDRESKIPQKKFHAIFGVKLINAFPCALNAIRRLKKIKIIDDYIDFSLLRPEEKYIFALFFCREMELGNK